MVWFFYFSIRLLFGLFSLQNIFANFYLLLGDCYYGYFSRMSLANFFNGIYLIISYLITYRSHQLF